ncbi:MAG: YbdK family carboxylate-amine ligase [Actinobacteria bacterium]|nr:MAG: YbdK family carboxylate-amine ligase [Actinomycetota bacterium]
MLDHRFNGPPFTIGIEEELMLLDPGDLSLVQGIEGILDAVPRELDGQVKPELMQSVLEIATKPCQSVGEAGEELRKLRRTLIEVAGAQGMSVAASGTHPFAHWEDQKIVERQRYEDLIDELGFIARRELIFGTHVHVAIEHPDRAIYVADGIRLFLPLLLALSANSPFWRGELTGMMSSRTPVFRAFPRAGIPPHYGSWETYSNRVEQMMRGGAIEDYTYLWWDVRPHPNLGTVETRIFDQQTTLEHTIALAALTISLAHRFSSLYDAQEPIGEFPSELIDDNKVRAALRGMDGKLIDFFAGEQQQAERMAASLVEGLTDDARDLGCSAELDLLDDLLRRRTGAHRQLRHWERHGDLSALEGDDRRHALLTNSKPG